MKQIIMSGYSPYPEMPGDTRLPHIRQKITKDIHKTALGAEATVPFSVEPLPPIEQLKQQGFEIVALEQASQSVPLQQFKTPEKIALLIGEEVHGIPVELVNNCDTIVEIPMTGKKESFNVSVATGIALYHLFCIGYN